MSITVPPPVTLTPSTHRFFDDLVTALASHAAVTAGYFTHAAQYAYRFGEDNPMRMMCLTRRAGNSTLEIELTPEGLLTPLAQGSWPTSLDLTFHVTTNVGTTTPPPPTAAPVTAPLSGIKRIQANIFEHAFIAYYERCSKEISDARSKGGGHPTLAFATTIRNSFAHGGVIHFDPKKAGVTVSWGGLSYSIKDNGRQVMYNDMSQGDVILLMLEMDGLF
jgi:hypothetical protein